MDDQQTSELNKRIHTLRGLIQKNEGASQAIADSFANLKKNPLNLNFLMLHVMLLSSTIDDMFKEKVIPLKVQLEALEKQVKNNG